MRILFNSKDLQFKDPFGTLIPGQSCRLCIHIPVTVETAAVECVFESIDGFCTTAQLRHSDTQGPYEHWSGSFSLEQTGLYYYYFRITTKTGCFRLFKVGGDTNMEAGDKWQLSCIPSDFTVPEWAMGGCFYQIFPDRFCKSGSCDLSGKLQPYTVHESWDEEVSWQPTADGRVLNNDFFGGNFRGITEKLPYIASLGVNILYLNPISKSFSSHRYDTGDYKTPDPMLGTEADFTALCDAAHKLGIKVILDGVFSHTGDNSLYFNKYGTFDSVGAYQSKESPYASWYDFREWPYRYRSWWDFDTLPTVNKMDPAFIEYIIEGEDSVVAHWLNAGCDGFRLDVADELPPEFLTLLKKRIRSLRPDALLMGEVWEDASNKIAYGVHRRYFMDGQLDSVMNYPFRTAIIHFLRGWDDGRDLANTVMTLAENYPPQVLHCNMNLLGTHDSPRILSALLGDFEGSREQQARHRLSPEQYAVARERLLVASFLQYTLPGAPSLYYGDEAGMEGCKDPFNRRTYPWGREDQVLLEHHRRLGQLRKENAALRLGDIHFFCCDGGKVGFTRKAGGKKLHICVNCSREAWEVPTGKLLLGENLRTATPKLLTLAPMGFAVVEEEDV